MMIKMTIAAIGLVATLATGAAAAEPIEGNWKNGPTEIIAITPCGGDFCLRLTNGKYAGTDIGKLSGAAGDYSGEITDPEDNKTYSGYATVSGDTMKLKGCALKIFCKSLTWNRL